MAASVDLPPALLPFIAELFADLDSLGSSPRIAARLLRGAGIGPSSRVLDVACGKGAAAVHLAQALGCRVRGIDACPPFIDSARRLARDRGVARLCRFTIGDAHRPPRGPFDAAVMLGLFPAELAAPLLRSRTVPGGVYVIDDAFRDDRFSRIPRDLRGVPTRADVRAMIRGLGDSIAAEHVPTPSQVTRLNQSLYRRLAARARGVARSHPRLRACISEFLTRQRRANILLRGPLRPGVWLVRRGRSP